jgi:hypothetical protein
VGRVLLDYLAERFLREAGLQHVGAVGGGFENALVPGYDGIGHFEGVGKGAILGIGMCEDIQDKSG